MTSKVESMVFPDALGIRGDVDSVGNLMNLTFICSENLSDPASPKWRTSAWWFQQKHGVWPWSFNPLWFFDSSSTGLKSPMMASQDNSGSSVEREFRFTPEKLPPGTPARFIHTWHSASFRNREMPGKLMLHQSTPMDHHQTPRQTIRMFSTHRLRVGVADGYDSKAQGTKTSNMSVLFDDGNWIQLVTIMVRFSCHQW